MAKSDYYHRTVKIQISSDTTSGGTSLSLRFSQGKIKQLFCF
jgi:hypothetical protein